MTNAYNEAMIDLIITEIEDLIWVDDHKSHTYSYFRAIGTCLSGIDGIYEGSDY